MQSLKLGNNKLNIRYSINYLAMNILLYHKFHISVMRFAYPISQPVKATRFGISPVM